MPHAAETPSGLIVSNRLTRAKSNRLSWALNAYGHLLAAAVRQDTSPEAREVANLPDEQVPEHVARLIQDRADPTVAKTMTGWLVKQYAQGALRLEDLGTAYETLDMFHRYAQRLPKGEQDLGQYQSLARVWEVVSPIAEAEQDKLSGKAQKAIERDKAYAESRILLQDPDGFTVAVPLTEFAAKWWGRGTRWCTSAEKDNRFWQYHKDAPLIVVVIPELKEKGKFQFWAPKNNFHFMDAADKPVSGVLIAKYWPRFEAVISFALRQNGRALEYVPKKLRTEEVCKIAVAQDGRALGHVPRELRTDEICEIAVAQHGWALEYVPRNLRTEEMCRIAVAQDGYALPYVPRKLCTEEMCCIAVGQNGYALAYVPRRLCTEEMYRIVVGQNGPTLEHLPWDLRTEEMCRIAVEQNGRALQHVPWDLRTDEICRIAVGQSGRALYYVPEDLRTEDMCRIAVAQRGRALASVPQRLRTDEMCRIAVAQDGESLRHVPEELRTEGIYRIAVAQNGWVFDSVPEALRTEELCRIAVSQTGLALLHVPYKLRTEEMCSIAVAQYGAALQYVPEDLRDRMRALVAPPVQAWDLSLLEELVSLLRPASYPAPPGLRHA